VLEATNRGEGNAALAEIRRMLENGEQTVTGSNHQRRFQIGSSYGVGASSDGRWLGWCSSAAVSVLRTEQRQPTKFPFKYGYDIAFSESSKRMAVQSTLGVLCGLDLARSQEGLRHVGEYEADSACPAFAGDEVIVTGSRLGAVRWIRWDTGELMAEQRFAGEAIRGITWDPVGEAILIERMPLDGRGSRCFSVLRGDEGREEVYSIRPAAELVRAAAMSMNWKYLAIVHGVDQTRVSVFEIPGGACLVSRPVSFGGQGNALAWCGNDLLAVVEKDAVQYLTAGLEHLARVNLRSACAVAFAANEELVIMGSWDKGLVVPVNDIRE
jgi:hypothetical protein